MIKDLSNALKSPEDDFVKKVDVAKEFPTQRVPIINSVTKEENKKEESPKEGFWSSHKKLQLVLIASAVALLIIIAIVTTIITKKDKRPKDVQIVNVVSKTEDEARDALNDINVNLEVIGEEYNKDVPAGQIISQEPKYRENYLIKEQSTVKVVISKGQELTKVPKVTGKTKEEAETLIEQAKLVAEIINTKSDDVETGIVIKQEPEVNSEVIAGEKVKVYVSIGNGKKQVTVPVFEGKTEEAAKNLASSVGLKIADIKYETDTTKTNGVVLKQDIQEGKVVDEDTGIIITVNNIPEIVSGTLNINVKSITGYTEKTEIKQVEEKSENSTENTIKEEKTVVKPKNVKLKVLVNNEQVEERTVSEASERESVTIQGIGTVTVKVYIDGNLKRTEQINLSTTKERTIE